MAKKPNEKHKDSVFSLLFSEKEKLIELYNAIGGTNYGPDTDIKINTLQNALYLGRLNDVSFVIEDKLVVLIEHQSTINENMPLRFLLYFSEVYEKMLGRKDVYARLPHRLPTPEFIVLYNGNDPYPEQKRLHLSDSYIEKNANIQLELTVTVYNINDGCNKEMVKKSDALNGYVLLIAYVKENLKEGLSLKDALATAIKRCEREGVLVDFLEIYGSEVMKMLYTEFNMDDAVSVWREEGRIEGRELGLAEGRNQGIAEGQTQKILEIAKKMKQLGMEPALITKSTGLSVDLVEKL